MSLVGMFTGKGSSGFGYDSTAEEVTAGVDLSGQRWLVTGCNSGIGAEAARVLALRGAQVLGAARTADKAAAALAGLPGAHVPVACELSEPDSVRAAVAAIDGPLDGILCNAGIMALPARTLQHGYEAQFFTNHVGHFLLVTGLLPRLGPAARVVVVSSAAHKSAPREGIRLDDLAAARGYSPWGNYGQSKLANILFARQLATRLGPGQTAHSLHPGVIDTNLKRNMARPLQAAFSIFGGLFLKTIPQGAATSCYVATAPAVGALRGRYFADCNEATPSRQGQDDALAAALWEKSEQIAASL